MERAAAARHRPRDSVASLHHAADPHLCRRELPSRLRAHSRRQGPSPAAGRHGSPAAQLADPGGDVPRRRPRRLMGGAIVTERIFNIHGVGGTLYQAINRGEAPTIVSFVTILVIVYLFANLLVDLLYAVLDPRIQYE